MARKIVILVAALLVPGGLIALALAWFAQSERGRKLVTLARNRVPAWANSLGGIGVQQRQAA